MATYWNKTTSGYNHSTYCYGYYQGQYYGSQGYTVYEYHGGGGTKGYVGGDAHVISGSTYDWGCYDGGVYLKIGNSSEGYGWISVSAKRVKTKYVDPETNTSYTDSGVAFYWNDDIVTTTVKELNATTLTTPIGKKFKCWKRVTDKGDVYYNAGDTFITGAGFSGTSKTITLYAIWEWDGLGNIGGKKALCYICDGHDENNNPIWKQVLPYAYIRNSNDILDWRLGIGGSS